MAHASYVKLSKSSNLDKSKKTLIGRIMYDIFESELIVQSSKCGQAINLISKTFGQSVMEKEFTRYMDLYVFTKYNMQKTLRYDSQVNYQFLYGMFHQSSTS